MPAAGLTMLRHEDILSYEEIAAFVRAAVAMEFRKVRITGGEPLVRKGVISFVRLLAGIDGIADLAMTTNATLLAHFAADLKAAGLHRVNVSLDAVDPERFSRITKGGNVSDVFAGIEAAQHAGLTPIKLNCVVDASSAERDAREVATFAREAGLDVRFIRRMDLHEGRFHVVEGGSGGDCPRCSRLRLSSDGWLRPCLFSDLKINVREMPAQDAIRRALEAKPESGSSSARNRMHVIGG